MTSEAADPAGRGGDSPRAGSASVLADRIAAALVHHEPGWRLPRLTALARRYHVSTAEVDAALDELASRHLLRRLPDGQVYRASPAEYRVPLEGIVGLASHVDPMGGEFLCKDRHISRRRPPEGVANSLGVDTGEQVVAVRCLWTVGGEPGAISASYLPERLGDGLWDLVAPPFASGNGGGLPGRPGAVQIEMVPPPPSVARTLRLSAREAVVAVTVRFDGPDGGLPAALTIAMLRPDLFRVVLQAPGEIPPGSADDLATAWTDAGTGWEP